MRQVQPLIFGAGLDRTSGLGLLDPNMFRDIRNVELQEGRARVRDGMTEMTALSLGGLGVTPMTDVPWLGTFREFAQGVAVGYESVSRKLQLFLMASTGLNPIYKAEWGTLHADVGRPIVHGAESYKKLILAHDWAKVTQRLQTTVFDGTATTGLTANLDGLGVNPVKFRGVVSHLGYVIGWGFESNSVPDAPHFIRVSMPLQPTVFEGTDYWLAGSPTEPVLHVVPLGENALAFKQTQIYALVGYDRRTFAIVPIDPRFGLAGPRLWAVADGAVHFWSLEGPRVTRGGPSEDMAIPLDLTGPEPEDLAAAGEAQGAFACFKSDKRLIEFHFGKRCYVLHLRNPRNPRWSYRENGVELRCAGLFYQGSATSSAPAGHPEIGTPTATTGKITVPVTYVTADGDESIELWMQAGAGAWVMVRNEMIDNLVGDTFVLGAADGVEPGGVVHNIAVRFRRGLSYTTGYAGSDPALWPAASVDSATTLAGAPAPVSPTIAFDHQSVFGGKTYNHFQFDWVSGGGSAVASQVLTADVDDVSAASVKMSASLDGPSPITSGYLVQASPSNRYFWVRHTTADGTPGDAVAVAGNPINVADPDWAL